MAEAPSSPPHAPTNPTAHLESLLAGVVARLDGLEKRLNILIGLVGAIIVALIAADGLLWNAINSGERELRKELVQLERQLGDRMTDLERSLGERIRNLELAFVRAGIDLPQGNGAAPQEEGEQRSEGDLSPGAGPAEADPLRPGASPEQAE